MPAILQKMTNASVVTYLTDAGELSHLLRCLSQSSIDHVLVVDHSPTDSLKEIVLSSPSTEYLKAPNQGYGTGHNRALRRSLEEGADFHLVVNPDVFWEGDIIARAVAFMENHARCGLVMPKILYPDGRLQYLCKLLPTPADLFIRRFIPSQKFRARAAHRFELRDSGYDHVMNVPFLSGCFMLMRCDALRQVGIFDERYFMYAEDLDLCRRIGEHWDTIFFPDVEACHDYAAGSYHDRRLLRIHIASLVKYFNKWGWFFDRRRRAANSRCLRALRQKEPAE